MAMQRYGHDSSGTGLAGVSGFGYGVGGPVRVCTPIAQIPIKKLRLQMDPVSLLPAEKLVL